MPDLWTAPSEPPVFNVGTVLLLTDGTLFAQDDFTRNWWRLRPDARGSYSKGSWSQAASARHARRYFASAVLADGRVFVAGGKSAEAGAPADLLAAEIYDPVIDRWDDLPVPNDWGAIGNAPCCVLRDGTVLLGNIVNGNCAIYDPDSNAWASTGRKGNLSAREESWTLLPDGSVLTVNCVGNLNAERYVNGAWRREATPPDGLVPALGSAIGPAVLLANGSVFATGATNATAIFTPDPEDPTRLGTWAAGPALPDTNGQRLSAADAPACLLPDGTVLFVAGVTGGATSKYLGGRSILLTYDPAAVPARAITLRPVQPLTADVPPEWTRLLLLPNGEVLFATSRAKLQFLTSGAIPNPAWAPVILQAPRQLVAGQAYVLRGRQLNGMSQTCMFGDDAGMATNYPLVRLVQAAGQTPTVTYCRSWGHSTMGVASLASEQFTSFTVPADVALGAYLLEVVANGIASEAVTVAITSRAAVPSMSEAYSFARGKRDTARDHSVQQEMFWRDLNEVHLLMDFISGRPDTSLLDLKDIPDLTPGAKAPLLPQEVLQRVCMIRFPPVGTPDDKADQAALLLMVKDRLNALASPAKGLSVAFTSMFASLLKQDFGPASQNGSLAEQRGLWQRGTGFALEAYPNLYSQARRFRVVFKMLPYVTLAWLLITALTSWDVVLASQTFRKAEAEVLALPNSTVNDTSCFIMRTGGVVKLNPAKLPPADIAVSCQTLVAIEDAGVLEPDGSYAARISAADMLLGPVSWWHPVGFIVRLFEQPVPAVGGVPATDKKNATQPTPDTSCGMRTSCDQTADMTDLAESVINVFSNNILPMMFGLLGTFVGLMRSITAKVRDSILSPRDYRLSWSLLPMGVVAGFTVGLIISPDAGSSGTGTVGTLSATALAFLAGYGVEFYFNALDMMLMRVFPSSTKQAGNSK